MPVSSSDFLHTQLRLIDKPVHRLGLAASYGIDERGIRSALDRGINYLFWNPYARKMTKVVRSLPRAERDRLVIATGPTLGFFAGSIRKRCETVLRMLNAEAIDILQLFWLGTTSAWTDSTMGELVRLREEGKVRAIGISIHDRERAGKLAESSPLDLFMIRYNAAHPGAERDIFPHLGPHGGAPKASVVAYTATSWRKLLKAPSGWDGPVPTAGDCYRFCLTSPHVDVVLTGPSSEQQLDDNLAALAKGPLNDEEVAWMRRFGAAVHG